MWSVRAEPADSPEAAALLRDYFAELTERYFHRPTNDQEIDETLAEFPSTWAVPGPLVREAPGSLASPLDTSVSQQTEPEPPRVALTEHQRQPEPPDAVDDVDGVDVADPYGRQADVREQLLDRGVLRPAPEQVRRLATERRVAEHLEADRVERADEARAGRRRLVG